MTDKKKPTKKTPAPKKGKKNQVPIKKVELKVDLNKFFSKGFIYLILGLLFVPFLFQLFSGGSSEQISISQLVRDIREEKVEKLDVAGQQLRAHYIEDDQVRVARKEEGQQALQVLTASGIDLAEVNLEIENLSFGDMLWELVLNLLPILLMVVFFLFIFRQARGAQNGLMNFGNSKAKVFVKGKQNTSFKSVGGMDEAKAELEEIVDFLKNPKKYQKVGARTPKGVLLIGPAGTGKTLLARAVAGEAKVQFLSIAGSEFMEMLVGVGASRARDLFKTAKKLSPSIIFIDEIDAIGRQRSRGGVGGNDEREQTLNQILVEMDGFTANDNVIVMAATNRGDLLDPALVRPGRFDRRVTVRLPDLEERAHIIKIHAKNKPFTKDLNWDRVAKRTVGFSGADLENMLNEAAIAVARDIRKEIKFTDIEEASLKVKLGRSKKRLHDEYERKLTAYHEAGHAVIAHVSAHADPVHRVSIVSRGMALGYTLTPPEKDKVQVTRSELLQDMTVMFGGRAAEELIFNELTAGASSDIKRATQIARSMVVEYGMSDLGPMNFSPQYDADSYGGIYGKPSEVSDSVQAKVDGEISKLIKNAETESVKLLNKYRKQLDIIALKLLEIETLDADEFTQLMGMKKAKPAILK
ncbi:MAG: ATP-dependent zinc metalloprotease FtsH [Candidatus Pacebacteria bacterium]|jgi:cell division protease FtsH|nr:ATP-dependent zinc metalloprotease FtsH [Candidatus Paceibacterota bacterium]MBT3511464.1 ATP-dependent zinc metalloprotease FtsH [Candidatus Paceibacterota bacterium]MBT4004682.1 ATP-dependent zinc metalloprotease FtsH [Candidatus Paceibacterota bacterium]MBT4358399.1 ATP-dependent zinc metalloprotease FtsH [Candidatus Paceibacterota bacterium]MBT4680834.1 ATP-dependent zinc metalloprotease FtsH [Candidatus Paceibacterota bacterium]